MVNHDDEKTHDEDAVEAAEKYALDRWGFEKPYDDARHRDRTAFIAGDAYGYQRAKSEYTESIDTQASTIKLQQMNIHSKADRITELERQLAESVQSTSDKVSRIWALEKERDQALACIEEMEEASYRSMGGWHIKQGNDQ